jgi:predicted HicB family RNase H-like nuclease
MVKLFKVKQTEEMINKTFRLPQSLLEELTKVAEAEHVSVNNLVRQCCEYALNSMKAEK